MTSEMGLYKNMIKVGLGDLSFISRQLDVIERKEYPPDTTVENVIEALGVLNRQLTRNRETFHDREEWSERLARTKTSRVFYYRKRLTPEEEEEFRHTGQKEMALLREAMENLDKIFTTQKILSERLCIEMRKMLKEVEEQLEKNRKLTAKERKAKALQKKRLEEELLRAKRNAAY